MGSSYEGEQSFPNDLELFCTVVTKPRDVALEATDPLGVDLGPKDFMTPSTGPAVTTQRFYRHRETQLPVAQRAGKTDRVRAARQNRQSQAGLPAPALDRAGAHAPRQLRRQWQRHLADPDQPSQVGARCRLE